VNLSRLSAQIDVAFWRELPVAQNPAETSGCHMRSRWQHRSVTEKLPVKIDLLRAGGIRNINNILIGMPEGRRQLGRPRHKWDDNVKMGLKIRVGAWIGFIWLRIGISDGLFK
jgi:hypothetical protein